LLLDLLISNPSMRHREIQFEFGKRRAGESKLDIANAWDLACFLISKTLWGTFPPPFISFGLVGASGILVHFAVLYPAIWSAVPFATAQLIAALTASAWNFGLNNSLTFRDRQLSGWGLIRGFAKYIAIASVGIGANVAVASATFNNFRGFVVLSALAGIAVDVVWKYFMSNLLVWRTPPVRSESRMSSKRCKPCDEPLIEIDHWGERLKGCLRCNRWQTSTGEKCRLAPDDIITLRALKVTKTETPEQPAGPRIESS
jgi:putative flippase GtrA